LVRSRRHIDRSNLDGSAVEVLTSGKSDLYSSLEMLPPKK